MSDILQNQPTNLRDALLRAATDYPNRGIGIFDGRGRNVERRSYADLHDAARDRAARFAALGIARGEAVLVALPTSWEWMETWFGLLMRGAWPVASSGAGAMAAADAQFDKLEKVMSRIGARHAIASPTFRAQAIDLGFSFSEKAVLTANDLDQTSPLSSYDRPGSDGDDVAFLQLTSGSTGLPRAVMISHTCAIHNPIASSEAIGAPQGRPIHELIDSMVSWLPLYHDMGLIGCLVLPLLFGLDLWLLRPQTFLARPKMWLQQLGRRGRTMAPAPNFGYQLCVERIRPEDRLDLDLSGWMAALNGAEMIRSESTEAFCEAFAGCGFDPATFRPCYGLAEATLAVTFDCRGEGVRTLPAPTGTDDGFCLAEVVSTGQPIRDTEVRITAPDGSVLPEDVIGEVRIKGPGVFLGYYNDPEETSASLKDGWFATGDLGFLSHGELYLTGRTKDLLIVRGQNIMPDEIERLADAVTGGGGLLRSAAFSVTRGSSGEEAVVVVEVDRHDPEGLSELGRDIKVRIGRVMGLPLADLVFVRRGRIPRTTSGKMQRGELRRRYVNKTLERI